MQRLEALRQRESRRAVIAASGRHRETASHTVCLEYLEDQQLLIRVHAMLMISKAALCRLIPHHGAMCLLDTVERWDATSITVYDCVPSRRDESSPARQPIGGDLRTGICGTSDGGACRASATGEGASTRRGIPGSNKHLTLRATRLDDMKGDLTVQATRLVGEGGSFIYAFRVSA